MGARRRFEDDADSSEAQARDVNTRGFAQVVWVHEGPVCVTLVDEPPRGFHDNSCRCGGCRATLPPDSAIQFL